MIDKIEKKLNLTTVDFTYYDYNSKKNVERNITLFGRIKRNRIKPRLKDKYSTNEIIINNVKYYASLWVIDPEVFIHYATLIKNQEVDENGK